MGKQEPAPNEHRIVLDNISWQKFERLVTEMGEERTTRFTYDRGRLEMMNPLEEHERCRKLIESLILVLVDEMDQAVEGYTAPLLKRPDLQLATEPDACYYIQHAALMHNRATIDTMIDPPPDLIQEVALTKSSLEKRPIYAALGIPEVWRYVTQPGEGFFKGALIIYCLEGNRYVESSSSLAFPFLPAVKVLEFIEQSDSMGLMTALRVLRSWVQDVLG